jgi:hypothetical protein
VSPGRFQRSARSAPCVYFSSAGDTIRTSSRVGGETLEPDADVGSLAWANAEPMSDSDATVAARRLIQTLPSIETWN